MHASTAPARPSMALAFRLPRWLGWLAAAALVLGMVAGTFHHHDAPRDPSHPCAVCALSHTPAAPVGTQLPAPPTRLSEAPNTAPDAVPQAIPLPRVATRAPPLA